MLSKEEIKRRDELFSSGYGICGHCGRELPIDMFFKNKTKRLGIEGVCKECRREQQRKYASSHREYMRERAKKYRENNNEDYQRRRRKREHKLKNRYNKYAIGAKERGFQFELELDEFKRITSKPCFYCGELPEDEFGNCFTGVDRIDSSEGYLKENVVPCCAACNQMKLNSTVEGWILQMSKIVRNLKGKAEEAKER